MEKSKLQRRKSSLDVDAAANTITSIMFVGILLAVFLFVILTVFGLSIFTGSSLNATFTTILTSIVGMVTNFFALMPTVGTIMAVVILIAGIVILVLYVKNMRNAGSGGQMTG
jgi:hypothetical protein